MLRVPDAEEERGGIAVGSEKRGGADRLEARGRRRSGGGGWMDPIERRRKARLRESRGGCGDCARVGGVRFKQMDSQIGPESVSASPIGPVSVSAKLNWSEAGFPAVLGWGVHLAASLLD